MKQPILRPAAARDVEEAYEWYESQRSGLGDEFLDEVAKAIAGFARGLKVSADESSVF